MKLIAFLLPQFHRIPENDCWWGEGFTEWTNTRKSRPLYRGHMQPKEPLNDYYYDLTDREARQWQADLARAYGIYGFCYYHYWFKGKRLLEKPFNQVLRLGEPHFPFCLSWANEAWTRKWDGGNQHILQPQDYGTEHDWEHHFYDLLEAFKDERYIRVNGKPLFLIYRPGNIPRCEEMLKFWNRLAAGNGLEGIHFVRTLGGFPVPQQKGFDASVEFEPHYTFAHHHSENLWNYITTARSQHLIVDYDGVWQSVLGRSPHRGGEMVYPGAFVNWDNTPRLAEKGQSCIGASPDKFRHYLSLQLRRAASVYQSEFLFINAWNEWAEGAYLEPDRHYRYRYLEAVKQALEENGLYSLQAASRADKAEAPHSAKCPAYIEAT